MNTPVVVHLGTCVFLKVCARLGWRGDPCDVGEAEAGLGRSAGEESRGEADRADRTRRGGERRRRPPHLGAIHEQVCVLCRKDCANGLPLRRQLLHAF